MKVAPKMVSGRVENTRSGSASSMGKSKMCIRDSHHHKVVLDGEGVVALVVGRDRHDRAGTVAGEDVFGGVKGLSLIHIW